MLILSEPHSFAEKGKIGSSRVPVSLAVRTLKKWRSRFLLVTTYSSYAFRLMDYVELASSFINYKCRLDIDDRSRQTCM